MTTVLKARAGTRLIARFTWYNPGRTGIVDSTGRTATLEIATMSSPRRMLLTAEEWVAPALAPVGAPLTAAPGGLDPAFSHLSSQLRDIGVTSEPDTELREVTGPMPAGTTFVRVSPGVWEIRLGASITRILPLTSAFEITVASDADPEDSVSLASGFISITREIESR